MKPTVQPARIPLGLTDDGRNVFITLPWYRYITENKNVTDGVQGDIESLYGEVITSNSNAKTAALFRRTEDIERTLIEPSGARIATLERRVLDLEASLETAYVSLRQLQGLRQEIDDLKRATL